MSAFAGGFVAIWLLSRLARILLKRLPGIEQRLLIVLSVALALAVAVTIAHCTMEWQAELAGLSRWGYVFTVYTPGAVFWAIFDLYRLSRQATPPGS